MAIALLQEKIRKLKTPVMVDMTVKPGELPPHLLEEEGSISGAYQRFCSELMSQLKGVVPALRFNPFVWSLLGPEGTDVSMRIMQEATEKGFYVAMDGPQILSARDASVTAELLFGREKSWSCDGLIFVPYIGSDCVKPFLPYCQENKKDVFWTVRTANKSAAELQDLLTGSRVVHTVSADLANRHAGQYVGKFGYSQVAVMGSATSADCLRTIRGKYPALFILVDGLDGSGGNAKNCSYAFDKLGHGAVVCAGPSVTSAWMKAETPDGRQYIECAVQAVDRIRTNLARYITVL